MSEEKVKLNEKEISKEELEKKKEEIQKLKDVQLVEVKPNEFKTRLRD